MKLFLSLLFLIASSSTTFAAQSAQTQAQGHRELYLLRGSIKKNIISLHKLALGNNTQYYFAWIALENCVQFTSQSDQKNTIPENISMARFSSSETLSLLQSYNLIDNSNYFKKEVYNVLHQYLQEQEVKPDLRGSYLLAQVASD